MILFDVISNNSDGEINHDLINKTYSNRKSVPHEWFFIECLYKKEFFNDKTLAAKFIMFVLQFYPRYGWIFFNQQDYLSSASIECAINSFEFQKIYEFNFEEDDNIKKAMIFGDIVTDFLIRFCNYSLIKCSGQKIIITAQDDCDKRFEEQLLEGYSLEKRAKIEYVKPPEIIKLFYPNVDGIFYKLPTLPTKNPGYLIDEVVEKIENMRELENDAEKVRFQQMYYYPEYSDMLDSKEWIKRRRQTRRYMKSIGLK